MTFEQTGFELWRDRGDEAPLIIRGEARLPSDPAGTVIICHGFKGFARFAFFPFLAEEIAKAGMRAITFDFSGSGIGEDRENFTNPSAFTHNTYTRELDDLDAVVGEARVNGWIDSQYGLLGHSRGGGVAILHASRNANVGALVTWAAIGSASRWSPESVREWRRRGYVDIPNARTGQTIPLGMNLLDELDELGDTTLNIPSAAARIRSPWLILHGSEDETVPVSEAEQLADVSKQTSTLRVIEKANHTFGGKHPLTEVAPVLASVTRETVEFFSRLLTRAGM